MCFSHLWQPEFIWNSRFITKVNRVSPFVTLAHGGLLGYVVYLCVCVCVFFFYINQVVFCVCLKERTIAMLSPFKLLTGLLSTFLDILFRSVKQECSCIV